MTLPPLPNAHVPAVLLLTATALLLFTREKIPLQTSSLLVLLALVVGFELFPFQVGGGTLRSVDFFQGFGHEALVAVCALMIAGQGIVRTGALEPIGRILARMWMVSPRFTFLLVLLVCAWVSAFINNVPVVVLFLPILVSVAVRTGIPTSSVLMPMGFATLLGGTSTTIGTSTNLLVVAVAEEMGLPRIGMFDFLLPAALAGTVGVVYLWLVAPKLLPLREQPLTDVSPRVFSAHLAILEKSKVIDKPLSKALELAGGTMKVTGIERGEGKFLIPFPEIVLRPGDHLVIRDTPEKLKEYEKVLGGTLYPEKHDDGPIDDKHPLKADDQQIAEIAIVDRSEILGKSLADLRFAERYGLVTLALHRAGEDLDRYHDEISDITLKAGDVLLLQGPRTEIAKLKRDKDFLVLDATADIPPSSKAPLALGIMMLIVGLSAFGILPIAVSAPCGALLMILTGCLSWRDATGALSAQVILIVVASLALGTALLKTESALYLASIFVALAGDAPPAVTIAGLLLLIGLLTNIVSNNAAAVIGTPIAISIAQQLGQPPQPFVFAVLFGANLSFITPMGYKTNLLVMNAGRYTFNDFLRVGLPLFVIMWLSLSLILPLLHGQE